MNREYLQFNNLVFNGAVNGDEFGDLSFKTQSEDYMYAHGTYLTTPCGENFASPRSVSLDIMFNTRDVDCTMRKHFRNFIISEIRLKGKLWAIENGELLWAYAETTAYNENYDVSDIYYSITVDFNLTEGIWHKADPLKTYLVPYNLCDYLDVLGYREINECCGCFTDTKNKCCTCDEITEDMALCGYEFVDNCKQDIQIVEDELLACEFFGDRFYGYCLESMPDGISTISENVYAKTDLNTLGEITIIGKMLDPIITVNGTTIQITTGKELDGRLTIKSNLECEFLGLECDCITIPASDIIRVKGKYGFVFEPRKNYISVDRNTGDGKAYVYIKTDNITF